MNQYEVDLITRRLQDVAPDFLEEISEASHHLQVALDILKRELAIIPRELAIAAQTVYEIAEMTSLSLDDSENR
jgi:hypothetical protein